YHQTNNKRGEKRTETFKSIKNTGQSSRTTISFVRIKKFRQKGCHFHTQWKRQTLVYLHCVPLPSLNGVVTKWRDFVWFAKPSGNSLSKTLIHQDIDMHERKFVIALPPLQKPIS